MKKVFMNKFGDLAVGMRVFQEIDSIDTVAGSMIVLALPEDHVGWLMQSQDDGYMLVNRDIVRDELEDLGEL